MSDKQYGQPEWPPADEPSEPSRAGFRPPRSTPPRSPLADRPQRHTAPPAPPPRHNSLADPPPRHDSLADSVPRYNSLADPMPRHSPLPGSGPRHSPLADHAQWHTAPPAAAPQHNPPPVTTPRHGEPRGHHTAGRHSTGEWRTVGDRRPPQRPARTRGRRLDASRWHWLLLIPIVVPLMPVLYNRVEPTLLGLPFFYWGQLSFAFLASLVIAVVHRKVR
jgi:hypothetical protein